MQMQELSESAAVQPEELWFDKMAGALYWKVVPPAIHDPFGPPLPDRVLADWQNDIKSLKADSSLRCLCDGFEVMTLRNLVNPSIVSDHPCITVLTTKKILEYIERSGVGEKIIEELTKVQELIKAELSSRDKAAEQVARQRSLGKEKEIKKKKKKGPSPSYGGSFRVIYR